LFGWLSLAIFRTPPNPVY
jgi:hypothetical protein